ncbi:hypothetical protein LIER_05714 [Lithospermum erythrorhizon]|uniref:Gag-pol polyprotein n=1 Tax=Lithospermum erythrorhizon TaxID=34254 RepID=A0AAV3P1P2_LITER
MFRLCGSGQIPPAFATTVTLSPQPPIVPVMQKNDQPKPPVFSGQNFKRWREQVIFYLTSLNLQRFLVEEPPTVQDNGVWSLVAVDSWRHSDYLSQNYLLTYLSDDLYSVYKTYATTKQCWDALEFKHKAQDAGFKKFIVGKFLDYKMVDGKSVDDQFREFEVVFHELQVEGMVLNEMFKDAAVIEK